MENDMQSGSMNSHILAGQWKQTSGELKSWWGQLTDDDVYWIGGELDKTDGPVTREIRIYSKAGRARDRPSIARVRR